MTDLLAARSQMAMSLAFHIIFAAIGIAMPGTVLSFELGLLWPGFMGYAGSIMNPAAFSQTLHMTLAAYAATGFAVAGIHAFMLARNRDSRFHRAALAIALVVGGVSAILQPLSGDLLAKSVARTQPVKLAAFEGQFHTEKGAAFRVGGIPDETAGMTRYALGRDSLVPLLLLPLHHLQSKNHKFQLTSLECANLLALW